MSLRPLARLVGLLSLLLAACEDRATQVGGLDGHRHRAIAGVSMGAIGATALGTEHPQLFDAIGALGGPLDPGYFLSYLETHYLGGFCTVEELEAIVAAHPEHPNPLDDPELLPCMEPAPSRNEAVLRERRQSFARWAFGNNGGTFDRDAYLDLFEDLVAAFGNPLYDTTTTLPPWIQPQALQRGDICERPERVEPGWDPSHPASAYPLVTFCDGETPKPYCKGTGRSVDRCTEPDAEAACAAEGGVAYASWSSRRDLYLAQVGAFDPCGGQGRVVPFALAVDVNGNGRRDFGEPILLRSGAGSGSVGGTEDFPARSRLRAFDPAWRVANRWALRDRERVAVYVDGGIRDIFQFGIHAAKVAQGWEAAGGGAWKRFESTTSFPGAPAGEDAFLPLSLGRADLPGKMLYLYGHPQASEAAIAAGDGDHVGTTRQVMNRLLLFLRWLSLRWEHLEDPPADRSSFWSRVHSETFVSEALGGVERDYAVVLPPGYDDPSNAERRYPVVYLLHGYGQRAAGPGGFWESFLLTDGWMASGELRKMILVFPSGRCCFSEAGEAPPVCAEEAGQRTGWERECHAGSFYVRAAATGRDYGGSVLDLMRHVEGRYRTLAPPAP